MDIVVFGAGSLGSLMGGLLAAQHDVTLVGREPHVEAIRAGGLRLTGLLGGTVEPTAVTELDNGSTDLVVVTVKAYDTADAARALAEVESGAVLSLQNGLGNEETLAGTVEAPVLAGTTSYGARLTEPGVVECTGRGEVVLGPGPDGRAGIELAETVADAFRAADLETRVEADMAPVRWEKLAVNAGINPVTALARVENGALSGDPAASVAEAATLEAAAVARSAGVELPDQTALEALHRVVDATAANRSSMLQDLEAGRRTEVEAICGAVVDRAQGPVPVTETLRALLRAATNDR